MSLHHNIKKRHLKIQGILLSHIDARIITLSWSAATRLSSPGEPSPSIPRIGTGTRSTVQVDIMRSLVLQLNPALEAARNALKRSLAYILYPTLYIRSATRPIQALLYATALHTRRTKTKRTPTIPRNRLQNPQHEPHMHNKLER